MSCKWDVKLAYTKLVNISILKSILINKNLVLTRVGLINIKQLLFSSLSFLFI